MDYYPTLLLNTHIRMSSLICRVFFTFFARRKCEARIYPYFGGVVWIIFLKFLYEYADKLQFLFSI